ncbi:aminotransferase class I/II-fold pyridoxal phosphate-dependent enzyme [Spongiimicrobium salis]|uniref:aminotransferase class I/II-fold pyridoxal phosphate-dependent enzyme n=1 Tax=Spongiimicrobium salis TaxID=1667022 RepID=UPI00374D0B32
MKKREAVNAVRTLSVCQNTVDFTSNDYLGFAKNTSIFEATTEILREKNAMRNGATGSRLISGNHAFCQEVERHLAKWHRAETALVFNSGYDANIGFFSAVPQRGDFVFYDEFVHASIRDGILMGNAKSYKFKHNDLEDLKKKIGTLLTRERTDEATEIYIVTEAIFSMDGDMPNMMAFGHFCKENHYHLIIDEAHAIGVFGTHGEGLVQKLGIADKVFARIITFGKAMGCHGAAILGCGELRDYLINFARSFIYTTALPPHALASILAAYNFMESSEGEQSRKLLLQNIASFKEELKEVGLRKNFIPSDSAIHSYIIPGNDQVKAVAKKLQEKGFEVKPILSPTVPEGEERLRFCIHSYTKKEEIKVVLQELSNQLKE